MLQFSKSKYWMRLGFLLVLMVPGTSSLVALGTYAEGMAVVQLSLMEESGIIYSSYEGEITIADFNDEEKCDESKYECYSPIAVRKDFSVRPDNKKLIGFLKDNEGKEMLIKYRIHRVKPIALGSGFEITDALPWNTNPPNHLDMDTSFGVGKSGNKRSFTLYGRIIRFDYRGTVIGTWEGLYLDSKRRKVHPFTVTNKKMAEYVFKAMLGRRQYFMGVSQSYVATMRDSDYDVYAIDYKKAPR